MTFSVWAPAAQTVKLELASGLHPMRRDERGWWSVEQPAVSGQTRYRFVVDDGSRKACTGHRARGTPMRSRDGIERRSARGRSRMR